MQKIVPGMRLEAIDRKNPTMLCVASVAKVERKAGQEDVLTIHFDGWQDNYDYEVGPSCP
jgi:hypothetical protein